MLFRSSLSYANVVIEFGYSDKEFSLPPEHQIRLLKGKKDFITKELYELKRVLNDASSKALAEIDLGGLVGIPDEKGVIHTFTPHKKRNWRDTRDRDETILNLINQLKQNI